MLTVELPRADPVMLSWFGLREHGGRSVAPPVPLKATTQVRFTIPVKPPAGTIERLVLPVPPGVEILMVAESGERLNFASSTTWLSAAEVLEPKLESPL